MPRQCDSDLIKRLAQANRRIEEMGLEIADLHRLIDAYEHLREAAKTVVHLDGKGYTYSLNSLIFGLEKIRAAREVI